jgi:hypothetical protein
MDVRFEAMEQKMDQKFQFVDQRFQSMEQRSEAQFRILLAAISEV